MTKTTKEEFKVSGKEVAKKLKEITKAGNARRIIIKNEKGKVILDISLTVGLIAAIILNVWAVVGVGVALATKCTIVVEKKA